MVGAEDAPTATPISVITVSIAGQRCLGKMLKNYWIVMKKLPKIRDFTVPELNQFRELCNFTDSELEYFNLRSRDKTNVEISLAMNVSESQVSKLAKKVKHKIIRVIPYLK